MSNISLLLVEDNVLNQKLILLNLKRYGFNIDVAFNGAEAIDFVKAKNYHLILMDVMMPVMDGLKATSCIREFEKESGHENLIVGLTANAYDTDKERCLDCGMDEFMTKPFDIDRFLKIIAEFGIDVSTT